MALRSSSPIRRRRFFFDFFRFHHLLFPLSSLLFLVATVHTVDIHAQEQIHIHTHTHSVCNSVNCQHGREWLICVFFLLLISSPNGHASNKHGRASAVVSNIGITFWVGSFLFFFFATYTNTDINTQTKNLIYQSGNIIPLSPALFPPPNDKWREPMCNLD